MENEDEHAETNGHDVNLPPDDDQDEHERRVIRRRYRQLIDEIQVNKEELADPSSDSLNTKLKEADELYRPVKKTREAALDSSVLVMIANIGRLKAQALNTEFVKFQASEFAEKLITSVSGQQLQDGQRIHQEGWQRLGHAVQPFFKRIPPFRFMHGSFEPGEIQTGNKAGRKIREKDDIVGQATIPKQLQDFNETDRNEATTAEVEKIHNLLIEKYNLAEKNPICYFEFTVNPHSFGQTIENIFYTSFLVRGMGDYSRDISCETKLSRREENAYKSPKEDVYSIDLKPLQDGYAEIILDADKLPVIQPVEEPEGQVQSDKNDQRQQVILSLTPQSYRDICRTFEIKASLIPTRPTSFQTAATAVTSSKGKGKGKSNKK